MILAYFAIPNTITQLINFLSMSAIRKILQIGHYISHLSAIASYFSMNKTLKQLYYFRKVFDVSSSNGQGGRIVRY